MCGCGGHDMVIMKYYLPLSFGIAICFKSCNNDYVNGKMYLFSKVSVAGGFPKDRLIF